MLKRLQAALAHIKNRVFPAVDIDAMRVDSRDCGLLDAVQSGWFLQASDELLRGFAIHSTDTVLDVGCGDGVATLFAARRGAAIYFSDTCAEKVAAVSAQMRDTPAREWRAMVSDTDPLPLPAGCVNKIIAREVLEHVVDPTRVMAELVRVAQPGARFLISVPDPASEMLQKTCAPAAHFQHPNHVHIFAREQFDQLVTDAGLVIEAKHYSGFYWSIWMALFWTSQKNSGVDIAGATLDKIAPPYHPLLNQWALTWHTLINMPESSALKEALDNLLPKSQIIIACKPSV